jgi:hypothetical protein
VSWLEGGFLSPANEGGARLRQGLIPGVLGLAFLFLYVIDTSLDNPRTDVPAALLPFLVLSAAAILLVTPDWIHSSRSADDRHVAFYRAQFLRSYIQQRYGLSAEDARQRWLGVLRRWRDAGNANHFYYTALLRARYECRMVFYLQRVLVWLAALSLLALVVLAAVSWGGLDTPPFYSFDNQGLAAARIAFPLLLLGGTLYLRAANVPDPDRPTGVWLRWKEINDELKVWWDGNVGAAASG